MKEIKFWRNFWFGFTIFWTIGSLTMLFSLVIPAFLFYLVLTGVGYYFLKKYNNKYNVLKKDLNIEKKIKDEINSIFESTPTIKKDTAIKNKPITEIDTSPEIVNTPPIEETETLSFPDTYLVLDVETPNKKNDSICQLGLAIVERGEIVKDFSTLINPQTDFDIINTKIHGIDRSMILRAPTIKEYWTTIQSLFNKYVIVGHNAKYDLTVLFKTLMSNNIELPKINFVCTLLECQNKLPELTKYDLTSLCNAFDIHIENQHNARYDIIYLSKLFEKLVHDEKFIFTPHEFSFTTSHNTKSAPTNELQVVDLEFDEIDNIDFSSRFVLTGLFGDISRNELQAKIEARGGKVTATVSSLTNYLVVGAYREKAWKYGEYGTKIKKALDFKESTGIKIISEKELLNYIMD